MEFYQTQMGHTFFESQFPKLIQALQDIAGTLHTAHPAPVRLSNVLPPEFWFNLYYGEFEPHKKVVTESIKQSTHQVIALQEKLEKQLTPEQWELFQNYAELVNSRASEEDVQIFQIGYHTAAQMIFAGIATPATEKEAPHVGTEGS